LDYTRALSFPRRAGTEGEQKAAQILNRILRELGYRVVEEKFSILFPPWVWMKGLSFSSCLFLPVIRLVYETNSTIALLFSVLFVLGIGVWDRLWLFIGGRAVSEEGGKGPKSMNLSAAFPGTGEGRSLYLMAHYDSKSQSFNLYLRTGLFLLGTVSGGLFCLWIWIHFLQGLMGTRKAAIPVFFQFSFFLSLIINLFCLFSKTGNRSAGSVDNASGVGILLEIARIWASQRIQGIDLRFVFTGAEEMGLLGSLMFQKRWGEKMVHDKACLINVDSVGKSGKMRLCSSAGPGRKWMKEILSFAQGMKVPIRPLRFHKGIMMDHLPFGPLGIPSFSLTGISKEGWHLHTTRDALSLVDQEGLAEAVKLVLAVIASLKTREGSVKIDLTSSFAQF
jgi:hypothetical protein